MKAGVTINRPPRDGRMAFIRSPEKISIELLQRGEAQAVWSPGLRWRTSVSGEWEAQSSSVTASTGVGGSLRSR